MSHNKAQSRYQCCQNDSCGLQFIAIKSHQKFCSGKCRRRVQHLRHVTKYPGVLEERLQKLMEWKQQHPLAKRVKRRFFPRAGFPQWLTGR